MNPILKVFIVMTLVCFGLYFGVSEFVGTTERLNDSLDLKSMARISSEDGKDKSKPEQTLEIVPNPREVEVIAPERNEENRIDVKTVADSIEDTAPKKTPDEDAQATGEPLDEENSLKKVLGISEPPPPVRAVDVVLEIPSECEAGDTVLAPLAIKYRPESPSIKGASMGELEILVAEYRRCGDGIFHLSHNPLGKEDATPALEQRRLDELKYFFLQHRVPKTALRFPESHD